MKTLCFTLGLLLGLNIAAWSNTVDSSILKAPIPLNLSLSGTVNGNQYQKGSTIESIQIIERGKTTYLAEEEVVLNEGFEVRDGAEFEVMFDRDSFHIVTLLTYNLWGTHTDYGKHLKVIQDSKADVVSLQEVKGASNFSKLTKNSDYEGEMCQTITQGSYKYGIGMLWNPNTVGKPIETDPQKVETPNDGSDPQRAYIVAEFRDFCFVATHYSLNQAHREEMSNQILQHSIVQKCISTRKPVYVAGDMNEGYNGKAIKIFKDNDYNILNNTKDSTHATWTKGVGDGKYIDLILEKNTSPYHKKIDCGIPIPAKDRDYWLDTVKISDHFPYFVKVKVK